MGERQLQSQASPHLIEDLLESEVNYNRRRGFHRQELHFQALVGQGGTDGNPRHGNGHFQIIEDQGRGGRACDSTDKDGDDEASLVAPHSLRKTRWCSLTR